MKRIYWILFFILLATIFFRSYQLVERFDFAADGDLYSWIVKDIAIDHHFRLIGQLTSAEGIFIGPFFYYLLIPFFAVTKMDPIGATFLGIIVGVLSVLSYFFVLSKLFTKTVGLIAAFLHAVLITTINFDRWIVPTIFTKLWAIWYLYIILLIVRGNFSMLPILGILIGLIWHVHIALVPVLISLPVAFIISKKFPTKKQIVLFFTSFFITSLPLILFETRHNFSQTFSLIKNFTVNREGANGVDKFFQVLAMITKNVNVLFFTPQSISLIPSIILIILILISPLLFLKKSSFLKKDFLPIYAWIFGVVLFFSLTSSPISEYYFSSIEVVVIVFVSLIFAFFMKLSKNFYLAIIILLSLIFLKNTYFFITADLYHKGYIERKSLVEFIKKDADSKNYPCIGITYITALGENVGFRYFFYLNNIHLIHPSLDIPTYNIVLPYELSKETQNKFGHIGLIRPTSIPSKEVIEKSCQTPNANLEDPMLQFVK